MLGVTEEQQQQRGAAAVRFTGRYQAPSTQVRWFESIRPTEHTRTIITAAVWTEHKHKRNQNQKRLNINVSNRAVTVWDFCSPP